MSRSSPKSGFPREGMDLFIIEAGIIVLGASVHFQWFSDVLSDLQHCWPSRPIVGTDLDMLVWLYWGHAVAYWIYLAMFVFWLTRHWPPWATKNPDFFTPTGRNMRKAWDEATARVLAVMRNSGAVTMTRLRYMLECGFATWTSISSLALMILVQACDHCPSDLLGDCTARVGTVAVGLGTVALYYDLRIKFGTSAGKA